MPFVKGQSGNPSGMVARKPFYDALDRAIAQDNSKRLRDAAEKLLDLAAAGEPWAVKELGDRLDGKAAQQVILAGGFGVRKAAELSDDELAARISGATGVDHASDGTAT